MASSLASAAAAPPGATQQRIEETLAVYKGLVEVSALINAITDFNELLTEIMEVARRVMHAEGSALILFNERTQDLEVVVARSAGGEVVTAHQPVPRERSIAGWVFKHGEGLLIPDAYADPRFYSAMDLKTGVKTRSILCVPLRRDGQTIGVLQVLNPTQEGRGVFDEADLEAFAAYANLAATAIDKLRFLEEQRRQTRFEQEMSIATEIQKSFLPLTLPSRRDLVFAAHYRPALDIGGDFYDLFEIEPDEIYFVIGDVAGKGIPAALLMAQALSALRLIISSGVSPADAMGRWNEMLCRHSLRGLFVTALLGRITPSRRAVEVVSAGHCPPWIARAGEVESTELSTAPPLGILPGATYGPTFLELGVGDWLVFYTDGLTESHREGQSTLLGGEGARLMLKKAFANPQQVVASLSDGEAAYRGDSDPQDDLTLLVFGFGMSKPRPAPTVVRMNREIEFSSHAGNLSLVRTFVREGLTELGCLESLTELMVLGIDEACTNVIRYAYSNAQDQLIKLSLERTSEGICCRLRDYGCRLDETKLNGRELEVVRPGGLGLYLIRQAFDKVCYRRRPKGTELVLTKALPECGALPAKCHEAA